MSACGVSNTVLWWQLWGTSMERWMCPWSPLWPWTNDNKVDVTLFLSLCVCLSVSVCLSVCLCPCVRFTSTCHVIHNAVLCATLECYFLGHFILECFVNMFVLRWLPRLLCFLFARCHWVTVKSFFLSYGTHPPLFVTRFRLQFLTTYVEATELILACETVLGFSNAFGAFLRLVYCR